MNDIHQDPAAKSASETEPPKEWVTKLQSYVGLLLVVGVLALSLWPIKDYPKGFTNFLDRTNLTREIESTDRGHVVRAMQKFELDCKAAAEAQPSVLKSPAQIEREARSACDIRYVFPLSDASTLRMVTREPKLWDVYLEFRALVDDAKEQQGLGTGDTPAMTPEMLALAKKLFDQLVEEWKDSSAWLLHTQRTLHALVIFFGVLGFIYRRELGTLLLAPIVLGLRLGRLGAKAANEVHKRV